MKKKIFFCLSVFNIILYLAMKSIWSGIEGMFGISWLQFLLLGLLVAQVVTFLIFTMISRRLVWATWVLGGLSILSSMVLGYMLYLGIGSLRYILRSFVLYALWALCIWLFYLIVRRGLRLGSKRQRVLKITAVSIFSLFVIALLFLANFVMIRTMPVVFAVEDTYQIVWTTTIPATGSVTVGDETYHDLFAGSQDSFTTVHKVEVPMSVMDQAGAYTISSTHYLYRGPYSGIKGRSVSKEVTFRAVDYSDGIQYYSLADAHEYIGAASLAGTFFGDDLDFLIMAGDIASHLEAESDILIIHKIAYHITQGSRPVIYARGNHEVKGDVANELHRYVGSSNEAFYFTFNLGGVVGIVLDLGEDHPDDWWEYYGTAHFDSYRDAQTAFIQDVLQQGIFDDPEILYRLAICHMPITYIYHHTTPRTPENLFLVDVKTTWTSLLNQLDIDVLISGHTHQLMQFLDDMTPNEPLYYHQNYAHQTDQERGYMTDSDFAAFTISRRSDVGDIGIPENLFGKQLIGMATDVDLILSQARYRYTDTQHQVVEVVRPFTGESVSEFIISLVP
jgi:predicted phosphodiesterase